MWERGKTWTHKAGGNHPSMKWTSMARPFKVVPNQHIWGAQQETLAGFAQGTQWPDLNRDPSTSSQGAGTMPRQHERVQVGTYGQVGVPVRGAEERSPQAPFGKQYPVLLWSY